MDPRVAHEVSITDLFDQFIEASTMRNVLSIHHRILNYSDLEPCEFNVFFPKLKRAVLTNRVRKNWKAKALFSKIDKKAAHRCYSNTKAPTPLGTRSGDTNQNCSYNLQECLDDSITSQSNRACYSNNALQHYNCLVIGSGPAGLRTAIELQLLGASRVIVVEKRGRFSRNNVLHLWPFVIDDLKSLGAKKFYGKFCAGSIDHISIRQLQLILLKICLMIGCDFRDSCSYLYLCPESIKQTQQVTNLNNSDNKNICDGGSESITLKCDLDMVGLSSSDNFVKVSGNLTNNETDDLNDEGAQQGALESSSCKDSPEKTGNSCESEQIKHDDINNHLTEKVELESEAKAAENQTLRREENLHGARAHFKSDKIQENELHSYEWDIIIGADGRRNTLSKFFPRKEFRGRLAIAITANFINRQTPAEASVPEISGLSFIYNQEMFNALAYDTSIQLENICYYKDDTHYFVMTAKKKSLLNKGVLIKDYAATHDLLSDENVDRQALLQYAKDAAFWTTGLNPLDFALNHYGQEDCALFDFTSMYAASNACKALRTKNDGLTLVSLVGDSLLEPFWPTGSGCARGFLSSFDSAWMCRQWAVNKCAVIDYHNCISSRSSRNRSSAVNDASKTLELTTYNRMALSVMAERESIYRLLAQTTSENLQQNYSHWTLNPHTRYPNLNRHLVTPSQVEHLITDNPDPKAANGDKNKSETLRGRRTKSPINGNSRKSPKKLKSANVSPLMQQKNLKARSRSSSRQAYKSRNRYDLDDTYLEFEKSYNNLVDYEKGPIQYLNYQKPECDAHDELPIPSISGTIPSSNNLHNLEARRARDIDECLRQRRQKTQISAVRDQIIGQLRADANRSRRDGSGSPIVPGNAALFNELRRLREQHANGKENKAVEVNGPLTLLNSMRRCASFAERVKSFESKLSQSSGQESQVFAPKTPIENVKDLPQFATLQELFVNNLTLSKVDSTVKKSKMPIMKLSKDDWNVSCWEKRLAAYKQKNGTKEFKGSTKSLNAAISVNSYHVQKAKKPERQIEVFNDRIKEMADKLQKTREQNYCESWIKESSGQINRQKSWVGYLRRQLNKESAEATPQDVTRQAMNPSAPNKPIKKLFEDDDDDDDGIDINKHYDHLCVNRPTNKYLPKNGYTSHLARTRYNSASKLVNRQPNVASRKAYLSTFTSRGSSASSTVSDYSTNTGESSSGGGSGGGNNTKQANQVKCLRCKEVVNSAADKISIGDSILHRICLTCANCSITLRTNEIQHYLSLIKGAKEEDQGEAGNFLCAICKPNIRADLTKETADKLTQARQQSSAEQSSSNSFVQQRLRSREEFLNERINYNELYKNILDNNMKKSDAHQRIERLESTSRDQTPTSTTINLFTTNQGSLKELEAETKSNISSSKLDADQLRLTISPSPVQVILPLTLLTDGAGSSIAELSEINESKEDHQGGYTIARSETIDGSEQVTLMLPSGTLHEQSDDSSCDQNVPNRTMIDEEEFQRMLHLENPTCNNSSSSSSKRNDSNKENSSSNSDTSDEENRDVEKQKINGDLSDDPSSLNSPLNTDDYDDGDDNNDQNSTYGDFLTSEEFGASSEREEEVDDEVGRGPLPTNEIGAGSTTSKTTSADTS